MGLREGRRPEDGSSFSGKERDRLFLNVGGGQFEDVSGVSGVDHPGDGRSFALLDIERDGRPDIVTTSANAPWIQLFRNTIGEPGTPRFFALRLVGANREASPQPGRGNRDGIGSRIDVGFADGSGFRREHRVGEGFAAQNSATMVIGLGTHDVAEAVTLRWPSGAGTTCPSIQSGSLLTVYEDASAAPQGVSCVTSSYGPASAPVAAVHSDAAKKASAAVAATEAVSAVAAKEAVSADATKEAVSADSAKEAIPADAAKETLLPRLSGSAPIAKRLRVMAAFATWCAACAKHAPLYGILAAAFGEGVDLVGLPMDGAESAGQVADWAKVRQVPYRVVADLTEAERASVADFARRVLKRDALPYTIVTDDAGVVLWSDFGVPTVSDLRALIE